MLIKLNAFENIEEKENIKSAFLDSRDAKFDKKRVGEIAIFGNHTAVLVGAVLFLLLCCWGFLRRILPLFLLLAKSSPITDWETSLGSEQLMLLNIRNALLNA